nr:phospholipase-like protein [Tanacetum cinerariifolium]
FVFMGFELRHVIAKEMLNLVDDLSAWNNFPWGLSVAELVKKIGDMQRDFQTCITAVEQYVKHHKSFSSFTENPDNQATLMNKITDMGVEFQRRIIAIEQYLKIPTSSNVENTSNVAEECMNVDQNTSCESDVDAKNVDNDSMDVDHDLKVEEQQNVAGKNLIDEFELQVPSENLINNENFIDEEDQQFSSKNLEVPLDGEELFAVQSLMQMNDFDLPKEVHMLII